MGSKRPFDEEFLEFSFKHPKQFDFGNKLTWLAENNPSYEAFQKYDIPGEAEGRFHKLQFGEGLENENIHIVSGLANKEFETSAPLSWVTRNTSEEDAGSRAVFCSPHYPEYFEFNFPRRTLVQFEDTYASLLNSSPRREIPLGPNHQADVPVWDPEAIKKHSLISSCIGDDSKVETVEGACVLPMPDSTISAHDGKAADGRIDCNCLDGGSVRCVQQHVKDARKNLRETLGHEKFVDLGFYEMGEEIAHKWTEEEERVFDEVVYSNPVSLGKCFWEHLPSMFPSRTKKELVSYYFNVFMLRRRAVQNRSNFLEIDSDDDEWQGHGRRFGVIGEHGKVTVARIDHEDDTRNENGNDDDYGDNDDDDNDDNHDGDSDLLVVGADAAEKDGQRGHISKAQIENMFDGSRFDLMMHQVDKIPRSAMGDFDVPEYSYTSFKGQPYITDSYGPAGERATVQNRVKNDHGRFLHGYNNRSTDGLGLEYAEPCDAKVWNTTYPVSLMKGVDLLPTCNMIEEIFGPCTWNSKSSNDQSIS